MEPNTTTQQSVVALDPKMARKLLRNLRILNTLVLFFSAVIIAVFAIAGLLAYKVLTEVRNTEKSFNTLTTKAQGNLDFKNQLCSSDGTLKTLLERQSDVCN